MEKITITTDKAPKAIGPYAQAIKFGNLVFTSGQIAIDPKTDKIVEGGIESQARQVFDNIKEVLEAARSSLKDVLKVTVYMKDLSQFTNMNEIFSLYFGANKPARSCVEVSRLPKDVLIEVDVIARAS